MNKNIIKSLLLFCCLLTQYTYAASPKIIAGFGSGDIKSFNGNTGWINYMKPNTSGLYQMSVQGEQIVYSSYSGYVEYYNGNYWTD